MKIQLRRRLLITQMLILSTSPIAARRTVAQNESLSKANDPAVAAKSSAPALIAPDQPTKTVMPDGVRALFRPDTSSENVAICIFVKAGIGDERTPGEGNVAARALFGSNLNQSVEAVNRAIFEVGGSLETLWTPDYTAITCVTTREQFENALYVLCEALKHAIYDPASVEKAKSDVQADIARENSDPFRAAYLALRARMYHESPYRLAFAGNETAVRTLKAADVRRFSERMYVPENTVISIVGNVAAARVQKAAENYLFDYDRHGTKRVEPAGPEDLRESSRVKRTLPVQTTSILAGFPAPGLTSPDYPAFIVLTALIGGGNSSRLFRTVRDTAGVGYVVGAQTPVLARESHLLAYVEYDSKRTSADSKPLAEEGVEKLLVETVRSVISSPPNAAEVERAKRFAIGSYALARQRTRDRAFFVGLYEVLGAGFELDADLPARISGVTPENVIEVAKRYLKHQVVSVVQPDR